MNKSNVKCDFCNDKGYWEYNNQTLFCPLCNPEDAELQSLCKIPMIPWSREYKKIYAKYYGPRFQVKPWLLVIHSGLYSKNIAEYFRNPTDGRSVSTHFAWSGEHDDFVQCVPFSNVAWHVGNSVFNGEKKLNFKSIGIELPGPINHDRTEDEIEKTYKCIKNILYYSKSLKIAVKHSDIDSNKKDPGDAFVWGKIKEMGLDIPFL